jgi:hypothetical protein
MSNARMEHNEPRDPSLVLMLVVVLESVSLGRRAGAQISAIPQVDGTRGEALFRLAALPCRSRRLPGMTPDAQCPDAQRGFAVPSGVTRRPNSSANLLGTAALETRTRTTTRTMATLGAPGYRFRNPGPVDPPHQRRAYLSHETIDPFGMAMLGGNRQCRSASITIQHDHRNRRSGNVRLQSPGRLPDNSTVGRRPAREVATSSWCRRVDLGEGFLWGPRCLSNRR